MYLISNLFPGAAEQKTASRVHTRHASLLAHVLYSVSPGAPPTFTSSLHILLGYLGLSPSRYRCREWSVTVTPCCEVRVVQQNNRRGRHRKPLTIDGGASYSIVREPPDPARTNFRRSITASIQVPFVRGKATKRWDNTECIKIYEVRVSIVEQAAALLAIKNLTPF